MQKIKWETHTMTFSVEGVWLEDSFATPVFVERELLEELASTDSFFERLSIDDKSIKEALQRAGWIKESIRGSVYASDEFLKLMGRK